MSLSTCQSLIPYAPGYSSVHGSQTLRAGFWSQDCDSSYQSRELEYRANEAQISTRSATLDGDFSVLSSTEPRTVFSSGLPTPPNDRDLLPSELSRTNPDSPFGDVRNPYKAYVPPATAQDESSSHVGPKYIPYSPPVTTQGSFDISVDTPSFSRDYYAPSRTSVPENPPSAFQVRPLGSVLGESIANSTVFTIPSCLSLGQTRYEIVRPKILSNTAGSDTEEMPPSEEPSACSFQSLQDRGTRSTSSSYSQANPIVTYSGSTSTSSPCLKLTPASRSERSRNTGTTGRSARSERYYSQFPPSNRLGSIAEDRSEDQPAFRPMFSTLPSQPSRHSPSNPANRRWRRGLATTMSAISHPFRSMQSAAGKVRHTLRRSEVDQSYSVSKNSISALPSASNVSFGSKMSSKFFEMTSRLSNKFLPKQKEQTEIQSIAASELDTSPTDENSFMPESSPSTLEQSYPVSSLFTQSDQWLGEPFEAGSVLNEFPHLNEESRITR
ncbi:uncharacterized protein IL334_001655 [Kwoniella shivajii]|uniref:Uncharacterized protein n=1 Tax=Kwoniella shivajii TaxID=564305 RepID=A0ABZ1CSJ7_9TREE|nr:hypothetical protein IL334_001655 [Kwoniella shivajii]